MSTPAIRRDRSAWERLSASFQPEGRAIIGGRAVDAADGRVFEDVSPIDGRTICKVARGAAADIDKAVAAARASFEGFGRDRSPHAIDKYCDLKTIWTAYS